MIKFNLHTHTDYCDGSKSAEEMIKGAIDYNYDILGITSHGPLPFDTDWTMKKNDLNKYLKEINFLKNKYKNKIKILVGLEIDYLPDYKIDYIEKDLIASLDYWIGSVHFLGRFNNGEYWTVDYNTEELLEGIKYSFHGDAKIAVKKYYTLIKDMVKKYNPPILGHLDLIKKNNKKNLIFNENETWYKEEIYKLLDVVSKSNTIIEINTGGKYREYIKDYYPSNWMIREIKKMEIPVTLSRDAHNIEGLNFEYKESFDLLKNMGFNCVYLLDKKIKKILI